MLGRRTSAIMLSWPLFLQSINQLAQIHAIDIGSHTFCHLLWSFSNNGRKKNIHLVKVIINNKTLISVSPKIWDLCFFHHWFMILLIKYEKILTFKLHSIWYKCYEHPYQGPFPFCPQNFPLQFKNHKFYPSIHDFSFFEYLIIFESLFLLEKISENGIMPTGNTKNF